MKAILFDCFGVLVTDGWLPFKNEHFGHDEKLFEQATDITAQANRGLIGQKDFINHVAELAGVPFEEVAHAVSRNVPNEELFAYIRELKKSYKIGFLSNIAANYLDRMFTPEHLELFDATSLSFENGYVKPQPEAYQAMAERLEVEPEDCVMIDDQQHNVAGARDAGMQGILYENFEQLKPELEAILADSKN